MHAVTKAWSDLPPVFADRLMGLLTEESRAYHNLHHVNQLLVDAERHCQSRFLRPLQWAILYHDAVYDPSTKPGQNEESSAELWEGDFPSIMETVRNVGPEFGSQVAQAIRATANHFERPEAFLPWQHAMLDLDLGNLGVAPGLYRAYGAMIRQEYETVGVTRNQWLAGRLRFIDKALACDRLFHVVLRHRESVARKNMETEREEVERDLASIGVAA